MTKPLGALLGFAVGVLASSGCETGGPPAVGRVPEPGSSGAATGGRRGAEGVAGTTGGGGGAETGESGPSMPPDAGAAGPEPGSTGQPDALVATGGDPRTDAPGADAGASSAPAPVGARRSLQSALAARWVGTRRSTRMEDGLFVMTGVFLPGQIGGASGHSVHLTLPPGREYLLEYKIRFDGDFDWSLGGKIPGLAGGNAPTGCVTTDGLGFSARLMWREVGKLIGYLYDNNQVNRCGTALGASGFFFTASRWFDVKQRVKLNTAMTGNGIYQVWVDDRLVINRSDIEYMNEAPNLRIDELIFQSFYGGSTPDWAPSRETSISFADVFVTLVAE